MARPDNYNRIDRASSYIERTGSVLEAEFIGGVDKDEYDKLAFEILRKDELARINKIEDKDEKIFQRFKAMEQAKNMFLSHHDYVAKDNYLGRQDSIELVEKTQKGDPENPKRFFIRSLLNAIKGRFDEKYTLKFFTAAGGTHLDVAHGIDGFFKLYDKDSGKELAMATIDLSGNKSKDKVKKADVLISINGDERDRYIPSAENKDFDKEFFNEKMEYFSEEIVNALITDYQNRYKD
ncbi:MAG: hypothetical protein WCK37_04015 [Candidatus Falkowbacteria bacterium]